MAHVKEFKRGMEVVYNIMKDCKSHSLASIQAAFVKNGIKLAKKKTPLGRVRRLGRVGRANGTFDVQITRSDDGKVSVQMVKGAQAKQSIKEKKDRYANLGGTHKSKKPSKKVKAHKHTTKPTKKAKKVKKAVHAGAGTSSESASASSETES
jgi:hypothetical protein